MDVLTRGFQSYLAVLGVFLLLALVWGVNRYLTDSSAAETGWPLLIAIAVLLAGLIVGGRVLAARSGDGRLRDRDEERVHWNSRK